MAGRGYFYDLVAVLIESLVEEMNIIKEIEQILLNETLTNETVILDAYSDSDGFFVKCRNGKTYYFALEVDE